MTFHYSIGFIYLLDLSEATAGGSYQYTHGWSGLWLRWVRSTATSTGMTGRFFFRVSLAVTAAARPRSFA